MEEARDWEAEAKEQGWRPKEDFQGPEDKWTDAKTFVEKGEKITGILKSRLDHHEQTIEELRRANKEFGEYQKKLRQAETEKLQSRIAELEAERAQAITEGDGQRYNKVDREIAQARQDLSVPAAPPLEGGLGELEQRWLSENSWYEKDTVLTAFADGVSARVDAEGYSGAARLNEIARRTKEAFPDKFRNKRASGANAVEQGGEIEVSNSKARTYANLPDDAKAACKRFVDAGIITKEEYVATYEWQ